MDDDGAGTPATGIYSKGRLEALTDGIMAVAMTILVLDLKFDATEAIASDAHLVSHLVELERTFTVYLVSFVVLGMCWVGHHAQFHFVRRADRGLMWINLAFMLLVTVVPFTTSLMIDYEDLRLPCVLFGAVQLLLALTLLANLRYVAQRPALRDAGLTAEVVAAMRRRLLLLSAVPALSMAVALFSTRAALYLYALMIVVQFVQRPPADQPRGTR